MSRQNRNMEREKKSSAPRRDAASNATRFTASHREPKFSNERDRDVRPVQLDRHYMNDLYERSSI